MRSSSGSASKPTPSASRSEAVLTVRGLADHPPRVEHAAEARLPLLGLRERERLRAGAADREPFDAVGELTVAWPAPCSSSLPFAVEVRHLVEIAPSSDATSGPISPSWLQQLSVPARSAASTLGAEREPAARRSSTPGCRPTRNSFCRRGSRSRRGPRRRRSHRRRSISPAFARHDDAVVELNGAELAELELVAEPC